MQTIDIGIVAAFVAGTISFLSPCVLPLVPGYISIVSGISLEQLQSSQDASIRRTVILNSLVFILGFSVTFIALGASATVVGQMVGQNLLSLYVIAGTLIVVFGLHLVREIRLLYFACLAVASAVIGLTATSNLILIALALILCVVYGLRLSGAFNMLNGLRFAGALAVAVSLLTFETVYGFSPAAVVGAFAGLYLVGDALVPLLYQDTRFHNVNKPRGMIGAFVLGLAFAFGWSPCLGPILAGILTYASAQDTAYAGVGLLGVYSVGLGLPFFLTSLGINRFLGFYGRFKQHLRKVEIVSGVFVVAIGLLIFTNNLSRMAAWFQPMNNLVIFLEETLFGGS